MYIAAFSLPQIAIACECARLPQLAHEPLALAGDDGVLSAVSEEAASFGIQAGMTASTARCLCQGLIVLPYDRATYNEAAESVWNLLAVESSVVEPISPELAFMEITGADALQRVRDVAKALAAHVRTPVFVGIGRSKLVAEHAAHSPRQHDKGLTATVMAVPVGQEAQCLAC